MYIIIKYNKREYKRVKAYEYKRKKDNERVRFRNARLKIPEKISSQWESVRAQQWHRESERKRKMREWECEKAKIRTWKWRMWIRIRM